MDYYSKFPVIRMVKRTTVYDTIAIMMQVFSEYGVLKTEMSDNGTQYTSKELQAFAHQYCFDHITSSPQSHKGID